MGSILLSVLSIVTAANPETSSVVAVTGNAILERGRQSYQLAAGVSLQNGDRVTVGPTATATLLIDESLSVDLGAGGKILITDDHRRRVQLQRGEARIFGSTTGSAGFAAPGVGIHVAGATLRVQSTSSESTVLVEQGHVRLHSATGQLATLNASEAAKFTKEGMHSLSAKERLNTRWSIPEEAVRLAGVVTASRHRKLLASQPMLQAPLTDDESEDGSAQPDQRGNADEEDDLTRGIDVRPSDRPRNQDSQQIRQVYHAVARATAGATSIFGGGSGSLFSGTSGGFFSDAGNQVIRPDGSMRYTQLVTAQSSAILDDVVLLPEDSFSPQRRYYSIGLGTPPTGPIVDADADPFQPLFQTSPTPTTIPIPKTDAYLIQLQPLADPATENYQDNPVFTPILKGDPPLHPIVQGADPLLDDRAEFNDRMTFALGEFALSQTDDQQPQFDIRRSDQDRKVTKDPVLLGFEKEQLNPQVTFAEGLNAVDAPDFIPQSFNPLPRFRDLDTLRRAAATTLLADQLKGYARRTGQTRFVVDGKIVDISGYRGP